MGPINIFITSGFLCAYSPDLPSDIVFRETTDQKNIFDELVDLFSDAQIPNGAAVNLIIDQLLINFHNQIFPMLNRRKIDNMLAFELEDSLIEDFNAYHISYFSQRKKASATTELCVYTIQKSILNSLHDLCGERGIDIKWVLSFNNFLDLRFREEIDPQNHVYISIDKHLARVFIYEQSFLKDYSTITLNKDFNGLSPEAIQVQLLEKINQKISALRLATELNYQIAVEYPMMSKLKLLNGEQLRNEILGQINQKFSPSNLKDLIKPSLFNNPFRVNFSTVDFLLYREIKKHIKSVAIATILTTFCLLLYGSYVGLDMYQKSVRLKHLEVQYAETIKQFLPTGASKSNAVAVLKNQVQKLNSSRNKNRKFAKREYFISQMLTNLSSLKANISSLRINRFSYNKQIMRFQGTVSSITDVELLKEKLEFLFPQGSHSIKINQRSIGNESVQLSASIHFQK